MVKKNIKSELIIPVKETGLSIGANRNLGINSKADIILFRDSDTNAPQNWEALMLRWFPEYDVVFGEIKIKYKNYWQYCVDLFNFDKTKEGYFISFANAAVKKEVLKENPFPDKNLGEDTEFIENIKTKNYKIKFDKEAFVYHTSEIDSYYKFIKRMKQYGDSKSNDGKINSLLEKNPLVFLLSSPLISFLYTLKLTKNPVYLPGLYVGILNWCISKYKWNKKIV
ncbi:MAG: hypothetical protein PHW96_02595 [Candidatus Nanoarchaeia archaeon]|nr:hypothetical protein [Candidatus Nanoarchaeia archaeon]